jgi:DNA-binding LacI/PurR family transcriptional regulator
MIADSDSSQSSQPASKSSIKDVALLSRVSTATVSRVLNNNPNVKPHLRKRVLEAMETLDYEPSGIARTMRSQTKRSLGLVVADIQNPFFADMMSAIAHRAYSAQYTVLLGDSSNDPQRERLYLEMLAQERIAGAIVFPVARDPDAYVFRRPLPMVFFDRAVPGVPVDTVMLDNVQGGYMATQHLIALGHRRIGLVEGAPKYPTLIDRKAGYIKALEEAGIEIDDSLIDWGDEERVDGGYRATRRLLDLPNRPTALVAVNNVRTLGMLRGVRDAGLSVPDEISLVGFDDSTWLGLTDPPLTTMRQPVYEMGVEAVRLLMRRIEEGSNDPPLIHVMQPALIERASTRALG